MNPEDVPGFMAAHERAVVCALAATIPPKSTWVEVGCWAGKSLLSAGLGLHHTCSIAAVDNWLGVDYKPGPAIKASLQQVIDFLNERIYSARFIQADSVEASTKFCEESVHGVFIDGSHDYRSVLTDIEAWLPNVAEGGLICGHDYDIPEVQQAVDDSLAAAQVIGTTIWIYRK